MFFFGRKKQVVIYSMDRDADAAARHALGQTRGLRTRNVLTLDRAKVTKLMMSLDKPAQHIRDAERILRRELGGRRPYYIVTIVTPMSEQGSASEWFSHEYQPATGIDASFDHADVSRTFALGPHKLLLLSVYASAEEQRRILSEFLDTPVEAFDTRHIWHSALHWFKSGAIDGPFRMLEAVQAHTPQSRILHTGLGVLHRLMHEAFPFSDRAARAYTPHPNAILYNAHQSLPFHTSGYATRTHGLARALRNLGIDLTVVTRAGYPADTGKNADGIQTRYIDDVPYRCDIAPGRGQWTLPLDQYIDAGASWLVEQARSIKPAVIHTASNYMAGLAGVEAARRLGIPSIYEMRGLWHVTKWSKDAAYNLTDRFVLSQKFELETARAADHVIAITGALKEWLIDHGIDGNKISLAPNAVDLEAFAPRAVDTAFAEEIGCAGKIVIGYAGSFVSYEGIDLLVQAVALLPPALRDQIKLVWLGDGPALTEALGLAASLGVAETIISLGRRPFADVPRAYSVFDICAFPRKGLPICEIISPLKPFEAMAMQKAIIASDVLPLREIIDDGKTGLLHRKDDAAHLSAQLALLIQDPALRHSCAMAAYDWVLNTRQWDIIAKDIGHVYKGLV